MAEPDSSYSAFVIHMVEKVERGQDGSSDPAGVFPLWWGDDLDLHGWWGEGGDLLLHAVSDTWEHGGSSGQDGVGVQVLSDIDVAVHDAVVGALVDSSGFHSEEGGLEENLWATESLSSDGDDLSIGQLIGFLEGGSRCSSLHLSFVVEGDIAQLLLDVTNDLTLGGGGEGVSTLGQDLHQVVGQITSSQVQSGDGCWHGETLINWNVVGDTISGVQDASGGTSGSVQREDSLD